MKVEIEPRLFPHRGGEVVLGNVYQNTRSTNRYFKIVFGVVEREDNSRPWNNVVLLHVDNYGNVVGASCQPYKYVSEHQDLIGRVIKMPDLKIKWLKEGER